MLLNIPLYLRKIKNVHVLFYTNEPYTMLVLAAHDRILVQQYKSIAWNSVIVVFFLSLQRPKYIIFEIPFPSQCFSDWYKFVSFILLPFTNVCIWLYFIVEANVLSWIEGVRNHFPLNFHLAFIDGQGQQARRVDRQTFGWRTDQRTDQTTSWRTDMTGYRGTLAHRKIFVVWSWWWLRIWDAVAWFRIS